MPCPLNPVGKGIQIEFISVISGKYGVCTYSGADRAAVFLKSTINRSVNWHDAKSKSPSYSNRGVGPGF